MRFSLRPKTLSGTLNLYLSLGLGLFTLLAGLLMSQLISHTLEQALRDKAQALSQQLALVTLDSVLMRDYAVIERFAEDVVRESEGVLYLKISTEQSDTLAEVGNLQALAPKNYLHQTSLIVFMERPIGQIDLVYSRDLIEQTFRQIMLLAFGGLIVILFIQSWLVKTLLRKRLIDPIQQLVKSLNPLNQSLNLPPPTPSHNQPEEVRCLQIAFTELQAAIAEHIAQLERAHIYTTQATERLRDGQRLAAVGQMAAGLAHNLNTPLANIIGYAQMAYAATPDDTMQQRLLVIERQAKNCAHVVKNLLTAARAPQAELQPIASDRFLQDFCALVQPVLKQKGLQSLIFEGETILLMADISLLEQVLFNLLDNAVDAKANQILLRTQQHHNQAWLDIIDNGEGIPAEHQARIFEAFMTTKPAGKGTGLGLYLSVQMLKSMQADLTLLASEPGHSHFRIVFKSSEPV